MRLAEISYFNGNFDDALKKLNELTKNSISDAANDALSLQIFIQETMKPSAAALKEFAKADLLQRQRKLSEALTQFEAILQNYPKSEIIDETMMSIGDVLTLMKRYPDAVSSYEKLSKDFPESIVLDRSLMKAGQIYELGISDKLKAIETYQRLLEKFPNSIYVSEARKRIRKLRGDNI